MVKRAGERLGFELSADRQVSRAREKILRVIDLAIRAPRRILRIDRRDAKQFARAFAIAAGDDRRVDVNETALLEKLVNGESQPAADAENRAEEIRARAQMRDLAQELRRVSLFLERIGLVRRADDFNLVATTSQLCPFPWDATSSPRTTMEAPVIRRWTSA